MAPHPITLMRHGRPQCDYPGWIHAADLARWIEHYDRARVGTAQVPGHAIAAAARARVVVTSTLARATSSVAALGRQADLVDACFAEAALPHAAWGGLRLPVAAWAALFRLAWLCGYRRNAASCAATRLRASMAAQRLVDLASQGPVLLVGHGILNRMIAAELTSRGWAELSREGRRGGAYWSCVELGG